MYIEHSVHYCTSYALRVRALVLSPIHLQMGLIGCFIQLERVLYKKRYSTVRRDHNPSLR